MLGLDGDSPNESTLNIFWRTGAAYTKGYKVLWAISTDDSWEEAVTADPGFTISGLRASTYYKVSVLPYSMNGCEILLGEPAQKVFLTAAHGRCHVRSYMKS